MRIGFSGVQGTGKTTLLRGMFSWSELNGYAFVSGLVRAQARQNKLQINAEGTFETQKALVKALSWHVKNSPKFRNRQDFH